MINKLNAREIIETSLNEIKDKKIILREETKEITKYMDYKQVIVLSGVRRCGKTYLLFQLIKDLLEKKENVAYINFENPKFDDSAGQLDLIYETFLESIGKEGKIYFFLDEIQNIKKWEKWLAVMYEKNIKFFVSGSNASLLAGEFSKSLSGRHKLIEIHPLDFKQFLMFKNSQLIEKKQSYVIEKRAMIKRLLNEYLQYGGFPEVVFNGRKDILKDYFEDILTRDIIARHNLRFRQSLKELAYILLMNISSPHSLYSLNKIIQARSINTIKNYLMFLEDAYLIIKVPFFSYSLKKQFANPFKIYAVDVGMRNDITSRFSQDLGKVYENMVAIDLIRKFDEDNVFYWKSSKHEEVDFVIKRGLRIDKAIQVCYNLEDEDTKKREIKGLLNACNEFKLREGTIVTEDYEAEEIINKVKIRYIPLWMWLLE